MAHAFAMPFGPELVPVLADDSASTRSFRLIRHADDARPPALPGSPGCWQPGCGPHVARPEGSVRRGANERGAVGCRQTVLTSL